MEDNNINNIFRDKFDSNDIPKEDWNTPGDEVWDNIEKTLTKPKEDHNRSHLIPFILSLALLGYLFLVYKYFQKVEEVQNLEHLLKECSDNKSEVLGFANIQNQTVTTDNQNTIANSDANNSFGSQRAAIETNEQVINSSTINDVNISNKKGNNSNNFNNFVPSSYNLEVQPTIGGLEKSETQQNLAVNYKKDGIELNIAQLKNLNLSPLSYHNNLLEIKVLSTNEPKINPVLKKSGPWLLGVNAGYSHWVDLKKGTINNPLSELLLNESTTPSINYQINAKKFLTRKFAFNIGLGTYSRSQRSTYRLSLPYSTTNEVIVGNEMHNYFEHSLPTSLGNINTNLTLSRSTTSNVSDNENVDLDFSLTNKISAINVPITFMYYPNCNGQGLYFESGINTEFIYDQTLANVATNSFHSEVADREMKVAFDKKQIEQINFTIPLGIGYTKNLGKDISIDFFANYGFGLNNVHLHEGFTHKIDRITSQITLFKSL